MLDPLTAAYLAGAAANVTSNILQVLGKRWSQDLAATPRQRGAWYCDARDARVSCRYRAHPALFSSSAGVRVVVAPVL
jgi:hypothetical protein